MSHRKTKDLLSPFAFTFWMGAGCVALLLIAMRKKPAAPPAQVQP